MPRRSPGPPGRYTLRRAVLEIEEQLRRRGRGAQKEAAGGIGLTEQAFSAKMRGVHSNWTIEEIGRLADFWKAPAGWPWIAWDEAEFRDSVAPPKGRVPKA